MRRARNSQSGRDFESGLTDLQAGLKDMRGEIMLWRSTTGLVQHEFDLHLVAAGVSKWLRIDSVLFQLLVHRAGADAHLACDCTDITP